MWAASPSHGPSPKVSGQAGAGTSHLRDWHWKTLQTWKHPILDCKSIRDPANELCFSRSFHSQGCNGITPISASDWFWWHCWWPWLQDFAEQTAITQGVSAKWSWFCDGWLATSNTRIIQYLYKYRYAMSFPCARKSSDFLLKARAFTLTSLLLNRFWNNFAESTQKLQTNPHDQHPLAHVSFGDMSLMLRVPGSGTTTLDESHPLRVGRVRRSSPATFKSFSEKNTTISTISIYQNNDHPGVWDPGKPTKQGFLSLQGIAPDMPLQSPNLLMRWWEPSRVQRSIGCFQSWNHLTFRDAWDDATKPVSLVEVQMINVYKCWICRPVGSLLLKQN